MNGKCIISFILGGAVGVGLTYILTKRYFEKESIEKIDSVKEVYRKIYEGKQEASEKSLKKPDIKEYAKMVREDNVEQQAQEAMKEFREAIAKKKQPEELLDDDIVVITPEEFGENEDYGKETMYLYTDGILADEDDMRADPEQIFGTKNLVHLGEYEPNALLVRNDRYKCYYEILKDLQTYDEATEGRPRIEIDD